MTQKIYLTRGKVALVDDKDYEMLSQWKWSFVAGGYAYRYLNTYMHRQLMNAPKGMVVDHINGNRLDNRKSNLRICSHSDNSHNQKMYATNTSGYKGVSFHKRSGLWQSNIRVKNVSIQLGYFKTPEEAAIAYDEKATEILGEFARLNFPVQR